MSKSPKDQIINIKNLPPPKPRKESDSDSSSSASLDITPRLEESKGFVSDSSLLLSGGEMITIEDTYNEVEKELQAPIINTEIEVIPEEDESIAQTSQ